MRARSLLALLLAVFAAALALAAPQGAEAAKVANPGPFNATVTDGFLRIGSQTFGFDPNNPITFNGTINSGGTVNIPTSGMNFPALPVSAGGFDLTVHINPAAPITGSLNPLTGQASLLLKVWIKIDGVPFGGGCRIASASSPIEVNTLITGTTSPPGPNTPITGTPYSDTTGKMKVVNNNYSVPSSSDCGPAAGTVNGELGLPSASGKNEAQFELGLSPIIKKGITAALSVSGNSGVRPYTVNFNAAGSTRSTANGEYRWDFDGNGTFDQITTTQTTSFTYLTAGTYQAKVRHVDSDGDFAEATKTITVADPPDLSIDSTHADPFRVGTANHYDLQVRNVSSGPTLGQVTVTDVVPAGLTITGTSGSGWTCSTSAQTVTCTRPSIAGNTTAPNIQIDVMPAATPGGTNAATVTTTGDQNPANNTDLDQTTVTAIDLAIDKSHQGTFRPGSGPTNDYTLDVENLGSAQTIGPVVVTDTLPSGLVPVSASGTGWTCGIVSQTVSCTLSGALNAGASADPITIRADATLPSGETSMTVTNTASVATTTDAASANNSDDDETLVIDSPDAAIHKSHSGNLTAGSQATYTLAVDNDGPQPTSGTTTVTDTLPTGLTYVSATGTGWNCGASGQDVTCTHDDPIPADGSADDIELTVTVGLDAIPSVTNTASVATAGDDNPANDSSSDPAVVRAIDLKITKSHDQALKLGRQGAFQIDVENVGDSPTADPAVVTDTLPAGLTYDGFNGSGWNCSATGQDVTCTHAASIADGAAADTLEILVDVGAGALPGVTNTADVDTTDDFNPANDSSTDEAPVVEIDAAVKLVRTGSFRSEATGTYLISVDNEGVAPTTGDTTVEVTLPAGLSFVAADSSVDPDPWSCTESAGVVTCTYSDPIAAETPVPDIHLQVAIEREAPASVTTTATVSTADDRNPDNDSASDTASVTGPDVTVEKAHTGDFTVGSAGTYTLTVDNDGPDPTRAATTVTDTLPAGTSFVEATGSGWACDETAGVVTCTRDAEIASGSSAPDIQLKVDVGPAAAPSVTNSATVDTIGDRDSSNNSDSDFTNVRMVDVRIDLDRHGAAVVGSEFTYEATVDNVGDAATTAPIRVSDTLPAGIVPDDASGSGWDCTVTGQAVNCRRDATLAPSELAGPIEIDVATTPAATDTVVNTATVATTGDANSANDSSTDTATLTRTPDLSLTLDDQIDQNDSIVVGDTVEYKLTLRNEGGSPTSDPSQLSMELADGLTFEDIDLTDAAGWTCTDAGRLVDCTAGAGIPSVPDPGSRQTIVVTASAAQSAGDQAETVAAVSTTGDPDASDDAARVTSKVTRVDLAIAKNYGAGPWTAGRQSTFDIKVQDIGTAPTSAPAVVHEDLPEGISLASATGRGWDCRGTGDEVICTHADPIVAGQAKRIIVTVDVGDSAVPSVTGESTVSTDRDVNAANDSIKDSVTVVERPEDREASKVGARLAMKKAHVTRNGIVHVRLGCPDDAENGCTGTVSLSSAKKVKSGKGKKPMRVSFGSTPFEITQGHTLPVPIHLSDRSRALLKRVGSLRAKVTVSPTGLKPSSYKLELRSR